MARTPRAPSSRSHSRSSPATPAPTRAVLLDWLVKLGGGTLGLGLLTAALSFIPSALLQKLPESVRHVFSVPAEIGQSIGTLAGNPGLWLSELISSRGAAQSPRPGAQPAGQAMAKQVAPVARGLPHTAGSFETAKKMLYQKVYFDHRETFYCGCGYNAQNQVALGSCGLRSLRGDPRALHTEAEHVFPAAQFGNFRACWRIPEFFAQCHARDGKTLSGRECCLRIDPVFEAAHNDLHNLYPEDGYINGQRSDYTWGMVSGGRRFGNCEIRVDASLRRVQPPARVRGDIARTMLYMRDTYGFILSLQDTRLYGAWNNQDRPDAWEMERNRRIKALQGVGNRYVEAYRQL